MHQHADIAHGGLELFNVFNEEECFEHAQRKIVCKCILSPQNGRLNRSFQGGANPLKHLIEGRQIAQLMAFNTNRNLLEHTQHRTLTDGAVLAFKRTVARQVFDRCLEQFKLIRYEWVALNKVLAIPEVRISRRTISKIKQCFKVGLLLVIKVRQVVDIFLTLGQQAALNNFSNVLATEFHAIFEARLDLGEVVRLLSVITQYGRHVLLCGHDHPGATFTLCCQ